MLHPPPNYTDVRMMSFLNSESIQVTGIVISSDAATLSGHLENYMLGGVGKAT